MPLLKKSAFFRFVSFFVGGMYVQPENLPEKHDALFDCMALKNRLECNRHAVARITVGKL